MVQSLFSSELGPEAPTDRFIAYYSSLHRLKKATAGLLRFFKYLQLARSKMKSNEKLSRFVEVGDLCVAEER